MTVLQMGPDLAAFMGGDSYRTPKAVYDALDAEFHFNDDPCAFNSAPLFTGKPIVDGLEREWGTSTFLNPPYSNPGPWCEKAYRESLKGKTVVGLLQGDTSTRWFQDWVLPYAQIRFVKGRVWFNHKPSQRPSIIVIWHGEEMSESATQETLWGGKE